MKYVSTRNKELNMTAAQAIVKGLAPDGGLMSPEVIPQLPFDAVETLRKMNYQQRAVYVMSRFLPDFSEDELSAFAAAAYGGNKFSHADVAPVTKVDDNTQCLELWHGPTCAFKDMALQMLPHLLTASLKKTNEDRTVCILTATSGDTGKAALEGFCDVDHTKIIVFYPKDGVSDIQELQMVTQSGDNVNVCSVVGNFDDAQTGVKRIFSDAELAKTLADRGYLLSSANSINWGRVLPQVVYYISAYCDMVNSGALRNGEKMNVCVPTGNFGDILAGYYAKCMGLPVGKLICASNHNNVLTDFIETGVYDRNRTFFNTLSPSMDILVSSNLERLLFELSGHNDAQVKGYMDGLNTCGKYEISEEMKAALKELFAAGYCDDEQTKQTISAMWAEHKYLIDPHTAVAFYVMEQYRKSTGDDTVCLVVSTASPFKFCAGVLNSIGVDDVKTGTDILDQLCAETGCSVPAPLAALKSKQRRFDAVTEKEHMVDQVLGMLK